jgi:hypothetical protein
MPSLHLFGSLSDLGVGRHDPDHMQELALAP